MWQKVYKIAERQFGAGKLDQALAQALKSRTFAEAGNDWKQLTMSNEMISQLQVILKHPEAEQSLAALIKSAESAFGKGSYEYMNAVLASADHLLSLGRFSEIEADLHSMIENLEQAGDIELTTMARNHLVHFYIQQENFKKALEILEPLIRYKTEKFGATDEMLEGDISTLAQILSRLGREEEALLYKNLAHDLGVCAPHHGEKHQGSDNAATRLYKELEARLKDADLDKCIDAIEEAMPDIEKAVEAVKNTIKDDEHFAALRRIALERPMHNTSAALADMLRARYLVAGDSALSDLERAIAILRKFPADEEYDSQRLQLLTVLMDMAARTSANDLEIEKLAEALKENAAALYSFALLKFRREGESDAVKKLLKEAVAFNKHIPQLLARGNFSEEVPETWEPGTADEAENYVAAAIHHWYQTPGAVAALGRALSPAAASNWTKLTDAMQKRIDAARDHLQQAGA